MFRVIPSERHLKWFAKYKKDLKHVTDDGNLSRDQPFYNVTRETLNRRLNSYFHTLSKVTNKYLRSRSRIQLVLPCVLEVLIYLELKKQEL